jgi:hypothetical protein
MGQSERENPERESRRSEAKGDKGKHTKCKVKALPNMIEVV